MVGIVLMKCVCGFEMLSMVLVLLLLLYVVSMEMIEYRVIIVCIDFMLFFCLGNLYCDVGLLCRELCGV